MLYIDNGGEKLVVGDYVIFYVYMCNGDFIVYSSCDQLKLFFF